MPFNDPITDGARGGRTRAKNLTAEQRSEQARHAAQSRVGAAKLIAELEARFEEQIGALSAKVADLEQRVAA